jgi:hypothetical protein
MLPYVEMRQYPRLIRDLVLNRRRRSRKQWTRFCRQFRHILGPQDIYRVSKSAKSGKECLRDEKHGQVPAARLACCHAAPQFVDPTRPAAHQIAVMCVVSALLAGLSDSCWAIASGLGRAWFMQPARAELLGRVSGLTLIGGGMWLSLARRPAG